jgi:ParB family chromosome partitioning protein
MDFSGAQTLMGTFKTLSAYVHRADESTLSKLMVESAILLAASRTNAASVLRDAASTYKVDTDAIAQKVRQEFATKKKSRQTAKPTPKNGKRAA